MKFSDIKVGKKYKIRSLASMRKEFGTDGDDMEDSPAVRLGWNGDMDKLCGNIITITSKPRAKAEGGLGHEPDTGWEISEEMLEFLPGDEPTPPAARSVKQLVAWIKKERSPS